MFGEILKFELKYRFTRPATYIYLGILFLLAFGATASDIVQLGGAIGNTHRNAPLVTIRFAAILSAFGMLVTSAMMSVPVYRDFEHNTHTLFFTTPLNKRDYLLGRFVGSFLVTLAVFLGVPLGMIIGSAISPVLGWAEADKFGPFRLDAYLEAFFYWIVPNVLFSGTIFFSLATLTRNMLVSYVGNVGLLIFYLVTVNLLGDLDNRDLASVFDPFGLNTISNAVRYWTPVEANTLTVSFEPLVIANRSIWLALSFGLLAFTFVRFKLSAMLEGKKSKAKPEIEIVKSKTDSNVPLLDAERVFSFANDLKNFLGLAVLEFKNVVREIPFIAIAAGGLMLLFANAQNLGEMYDTPTYPVTYQVIELMSGSFALFIVIIITFYSGELVWRERTYKINQMIDALPTPNWLFPASKTLAMWMVVAFLMAILFVTCVLIQASKGFFVFNFPLYFRDLFGLKLISFCLVVVLSMFIQTMVNNKYVGHFVVVLYYIANIALPALDFEHNLYRFGENPGYEYSDMNKFGHYLSGVRWFNLYWAFFAAILAVVINLFYVRGTEGDAGWRLKLALRRFQGSARLALGLALVGFVSVGGFIFYNTNVLNTYRTSDQTTKLQADFEKKYKKYENTKFPYITDVKVDVDLFPSELRAVARGVFRLKNKQAQPIDTILVNYSPEEGPLKSLTIPGGSLALDDKEFGVRIYKLNKPLAPEDSIEMRFEIDYKTVGFTNNMGQTAIVENGTFFNSSIFPTLGYNTAFELSDPDKRKNHKLKPRPRMASIHNAEQQNHNYISADANWVTFETTVSTDPDQIALAPGYLQREWTQNGRRYFHYKMDTPILNFYSFLSARYEVKRSKWKDVNLEVYYHKGHEYNVDKMIESMKHSLEYYSKNFSPYQHRQARIIEFPRYNSFAQSFPNTIPYSESIGFIARLTEKDDLDYVYFVTAHEIAHQWWAHQVIGGNVQGSTMLSESFAEYSALMVMQERYGKTKMRKFLEHELDGYLRGRRTETQKELPLYLVENQQYIHYTKGSMVMYAMQDYIGEDSLNKALSRFVKDYGYKGTPYPTSLDFLKYLKDVTSDSLRYTIKDMFETITLYSNRVTEAYYEKTPDGKYKVTMEVSSEKFRADSIGNETPIAVDDWIDIGVLTEEDAPPLYLQRKKINKPKMKFEMIVSQKPEEVGIDPYHKLIDRVIRDNRKKISQKGA